jgi:hypothetical protein
LGSCIAMCGKLFTNLFPFLDISLTTNEIKGDDFTANACISIGELDECGNAALVSELRLGQHRPSPNM